jgi:hypothetical protein
MDELLESLPNFINTHLLDRIESQRIADNDLMSINPFAITQPNVQQAHTEIVPLSDGRSMLTLLEDYGNPHPPHLRVILTCIWMGWNIVTNIFDIKFNPT